MSKEILDFGRWPSQISAEFVAGKALRFQTVQALEDCVYWSELRPLEKGRAAIMCASADTSPVDLLPLPYSARSKVHEYGGNAFLATATQLFFINSDDQDIWSIAYSSASKSPQAPQRITEAPQWRFADLAYDAPRNRLICVAEHHDQNAPHPENLLVSVSLDDASEKQVVPLVFGNDFYASPRLSPNGQQLAFVSWNLPDMPWESAKLHIADLQCDGSIDATHTPNPLHNGASFQPEWDQNGDLWFINDDTGFGQLYRTDGHDTTLFPIAKAECGLPLWVFGMKTYGFLDDGRIAIISLAQGKASISLIDPAHQNHVTCPGTGSADGNTEICTLDQLVTIDNKIVGILSRLDKPNAIASIQSQTGKIRTIKSSIHFDHPLHQTSIAKRLVFENEQGQMVSGNYYPPANQSFEAPKGARPPVIFTAHGGPTAFSDCGLTPKIQFWTSRGFGYFDVNYSGSWGFGKAYRERLDGQWGLRDVADMDAAAQYLVSEGLADPKRLLISGSSAGGYTVLMALVTSDHFAAGASYYGISDLARLADSTHKFEAGYIEKLLGLTPENRSVILRSRSPLYSADQISSPVIFFQGLEDKVVPPDQAEIMVEALKKRGIHVCYKTFPDEGHGFRGSKTIETALTMEYDFYTDVLGL